jgi:hypothetical protein
MPSIRPAPSAAGEPSRSRAMAPSVAQWRICGNERSASDTDREPFPPAEQLQRDATTFQLEDRVFRSCIHSQ